MIETQAVIARIRAHKLIAIVRGLPEDKLLRVADALYEGGVRAVESPFDHRRADCESYGAAMIALRGGVPVIPAYIDGPYRCFHHVDIHFGMPIDLSDLARRLDSEALSTATQRISDAIWGLSNTKLTSKNHQ